MKTGKQPFFFTIITIIAMALLRWVLQTFEWQSPLFAFLVNWLVMAWIATSSEVIQVAFAPGYYAIKPFEQSGRLYERLGIRFFKRLVRRGPLAIFSLNLRFPPEKTVPALRVLEGKMRNAETLHLLIFLIMFLFIGYALWQGWLDAVGWLLLFNLLLNVYPVMLQRYNRIRLQELIQQQEESLTVNHAR
ncbi:MAG: hypothetical protein DYG89_02360 [Caldilinea sp. CFX5]|nr:hypothetical protein [Caldilinea sp. CFX5]